MSQKRHKKSKTNKKSHKSPKKGHKKSPKKSPQSRNDAVNDNPVSPSLGDANAFNLLLQKHSNAVEVLINVLMFYFSLF
jgi:hypothetical protein